MGGLDWTNPIEYPSLPLSATVILCYTVHYVVHASCKSREELGINCFIAIEIVPVYWQKMYLVHNKAAIQMINKDRRGLHSSVLLRRGWR
jgi:hypothetical protein